MTSNRADFDSISLRMRAAFAAGGIAVATAGFCGPLAAVEFKPMEVAVLQGLDKVTARISTFEAPLDQTVTFGTLEITARTCQRTPPEEPPESAAFIEIVDARPDRDAVDVFSGWMFASSPALSALEHPVYDVWVIDCVTAGDEAPAADETGENPETENDPQ